MQMSSEKSPLGHSADQASCSSRDPTPHPHPRQGNGDPGPCLRPGSSRSAVFRPCPRPEEEEVGCGEPAGSFTRNQGPLAGQSMWRSPGHTHWRGAEYGGGPCRPRFLMFWAPSVGGHGNMQLTVGPDPPHPKSHRLTGAATGPSAPHIPHTGPPRAGPVWLSLCRTSSGPLLLGPGLGLPVSGRRPPSDQPPVRPFLGVGHHPSSALVPDWPGPARQQPPLLHPRPGTAVPGSHPHIPQGLSEGTASSQSSAATPPPPAVTAGTEEWSRLLPTGREGAGP